LTLAENEIISRYINEKGLVIATTAENQPTKLKPNRFYAPGRYPFLLPIIPYPSGLEKDFAFLL